MSLTAVFSTCAGAIAIRLFSIVSARDRTQGEDRRLL